MAGPTVVELSRAAVRRLAEVAPTADDALEALGQIDGVGGGPPYTIAIAGDHAARTALLNELAGQPLFDSARHDPAQIVMTLQRGTATSVRARWRDGSVDNLTAEPTPANAQAAKPRRRDPVAAPPPQANPPAIPEPAAIIRRPPWWAVWRWIWLWWRAWRADPGVRAAPARAATVVAPPSAELLDQASRTLALAAQPAVASPPARPHRLRDALRDWPADDALDGLFVEVAGGALPDEVVVIELPARANAKALDAARVDACLVACGDAGFAMTTQLAAALAIVPHLFAVGSAALPPDGGPRVRRLGPTSDVAAALIRIATIERALTVGGYAVATLTAGAAKLDEAIADAEAGFRARIADLEARRIASPDDHTAIALAGLRASIVDHAHRAVQRAADQLGGAIEQWGAAWAVQLRDAGSTDALRATAARLDGESLTALEAAKAEAYRALIDELTSGTQVRYAALVSELDAARAESPPSWLTIDVPIGEPIGGTSLGKVARRLTSLFRSLDALRGDALALLEDRVNALRHRATADVLDTEPRLEPAITATLAIALRAEVKRHGLWLAAELERERLAIDGERAQLAVLAIARDTAASDERELGAALRKLAAELP